MSRTHERLSLFELGRPWFAERQTLVVLVLSSKASVDLTSHLVDVLVEAHSPLSRSSWGWSVSAPVVVFRTLFPRAGCASEGNLAAHRGTSIELAALAFALRLSPPSTRKALPSRGLEIRNRAGIEPDRTADTNAWQDVLSDQLVNARIGL